MIVFDLQCRPAGHRFEGWFGSSADYENQRERGLVICPRCSSANVAKAPMAPSVGRKGNQLTPSAPPQPARSAMAHPGLSPEAARLMRAMANMQAEALQSSRWVGENFAEDARAMHYGEREHEAIHGQATLEEAKDLVEEGIEVAPLLFPVAPPGEAN